MTLELTIRKGIYHLSRDARKALSSKCGQPSYMTTLINHYFTTAAEQLGISHVWLGRVLEFRRGNEARRMCGAYTDLDSMPTLRIAGDKVLCATMFRAEDLPVPDFHEVPSGDFKAAQRAVGKIGGLVVVKPAKDTCSGLGVTIGISAHDRKKFREAFFAASIHSPSVLIEEYVPGDNYRMLVCRGALLSVVKRVPAFVTADGKSTLKGLVEKENERRMAKLLQLPERVLHPVLLPIKPDLGYLAQQGRSLADVPPAGELIECRKECNYSLGGGALEVTDSVHPSLSDMAVRASRAIGIQLSGVDFICRDITAEASLSGGKINEINTSPGLLPHYEISNVEQRRDVAVDILKAMFVRS